MDYYYEIDLSAALCFFKIKINDVELLSMNVEGQTRIDIPINSLILESGPQEIEVIATPLNGQKELNKEAYIRYRVNVFDVSSGDYKFIKRFDEYYTPSVQKGIPITAHKSKFEATVPYKLQAWQNGINLKDVKFDVKKELIKKYNQIIQKIKNGDYEAFIKEYSKKEFNNATSMYLSSEEAAARMKDIIEDMQNGFKVQDLPEDVFVEYSAYGKVVSLKCSDFMSALRLENMDTGEELILQITFYIPEGKDEFEVI